ncbi:MAG: NHLP bacteriocin export ABC transporter permease/ATPase subunit [Proteobacteria bacterium]|nr:NHLP bacteriocin export ABC transporter permease/ATPase subunit [Pseudomonadota bacterium]
MSASATALAGLDLAALAAPGRLARPARLYALVLGPDGAPGRRCFVAELAEGAAVFALAADGVSFRLVGHDAASDAPLLAAGPIDAVSLDAWHAALLSWPGFARSDGAAVLMVAGESRGLAAGAVVSARDLVWLQADAAVLRYPATDTSPPSATEPFLVLSSQVLAEVFDAVDAVEVRAIASAALLERQPADTLGATSLLLASRLAASIVQDEAARVSRAGQRLAQDEAEVAQAVQRLSDAAALRRPKNAADAPGPAGALAGALAVIAEQEGFEVRPPHDDDATAFLLDRLERFGSASGFRFRPIALDGDWWQEEGPSFLALDAAGGQPRAVVWRRRRWRLVDPESRAETAVDATVAASLQPRGYMLYPVLPERVSMRDVWRFTVFGAHGDIARLVVGAGAAVLSSLLVPVTTGAVLGYAVPDGRTALLTDMMILLVAASIGNIGFQVVRAVAMTRLGSYVDRRLQPAIWDRVMRLKTSFFRGYSVGDLTLRILGIDTIRRIFAGQTLNALIGGVFSVANLGIMLVYDATLAAFAVGYTIVAATFLFFLGRRKIQLDRLVLERKGVVTGMLMEILGGIAKLRVAAAEMRAFSRWSSAFAEQRALDGRSGQVGSWQIVVSTTLPIVGTLCVFAIAGSERLLEVAAFAAFNSAFAQFTGAILNLTGSLNQALAAVPLFARIRPVFEAPLEVDSRRIDPGPLAGHVAVRNLSFRYAPDGPWTLDGVDFEVRPGECVAIVGPSGSGKSTLLRLLLGFETPERGGVYYDDRDLETLDLRRVRGQVGTVLETAGLVPGTILENIAGSAAISREEVVEATRLAGLEKDIAGMPLGLDTMIAEGGGQLSGGQRQRVMIARALVGRPRLIFFDQATSALDNRTQAIVGRSLAAMNATRIIIAHRLSTIRDADRIVVLENGRVVETGTYEALVGRDGAFRRLVQRQLL